MKVKIGDTWYSDKDTQIAVIFDDWQLEEIKKMTPETRPKRRAISGPFESPDSARAWADEVTE